jgi:4-hydroxyphenylpyruvate dioxygenase
MTSSQGILSSKGKLASKGKLGLTRLLGIHYYVRDLERSRRFYTQCLDFAETAQSGDSLTREGRQRSLVFEAGGCSVVCSEPVGDGGRAARYLSRHPAGLRGGRHRGHVPHAR